MNYEQARQRQDDGRWDWTSMRDGKIWPGGYCVGWPTNEDIQMMSVYPGQYPTEEMLRTREKYHTDGHATKEEAERCYYDFEVDRLHQVDVIRPGVVDGRVPCDVVSCLRYTDKGLQAPGGAPAVPLCGFHRTTAGYKATRPFRPGIWRAHS